jgi:hypothetical protein
MHYTVNKSGYSSYDLFNEQGQPIGQLKFSVWSISAGKAKIITENAEYDIYSTGFWQMKKVIARDGIQVCEIGPRVWKGLEITFENRGRFLFKKKSFWGTGEYVLTDDNGTTFATIHVYFRWKILGFEYNIKVQDNLFDGELNALLPFIMLYSACYLRMRQSS